MILIKSAPYFISSLTAFTKKSFPAPRLNLRFCTILDNSGFLANPCDRSPWLPAAHRNLGAATILDPVIYPFSIALFTSRTPKPFEVIPPGCLTVVNPLESVFCAVLMIAIVFASSEVVYTSSLIVCQSI